MSTGEYKNFYLLDETVRLNTWGCGLTEEQQKAVETRFSTAFQLINAKVRLSSTLASAISAVEEIIVPASNNVNLGAGTRGTIVLSLPYIESFSIQWLASLMAHEGQHECNKGMFSGEYIWRDEQSACLSQLSLGLQIGMPHNEIEYLQKWMRDDNKEALAAHMKGYAGPANGPTTA